jgi:hypothetical protein
VADLELAITEIFMRTSELNSLTTITAAYSFFAFERPRQLFVAEHGTGAL